MRKFLFALLALSTAFLAQPASAAIFDAADILPRNSGAVGAFGEVLLSDPTSEGLEAHGRYGLSDDWNIGAIVGTGTKNKNFRLGAEGVFNLIPDWTGQLGVSFLGTAIYLHRPGGGGLQMRVAPMIHKRLTTGFTGYPANIYLALPFYIDARQGTYNTATQLVVGSDFDIADAGRYYISTEAGIRLARADSYILLGVGIRLGDLRFEKRDRSPETVPTSAPARKRANSLKEKEYTDEDFKK